jgi:hypothetical protein
MSEPAAHLPMRPFYFAAAYFAALILTPVVFGKYLGLVLAFDIGALFSLSLHLFWIYQVLAFATFSLSGAFAARSMVIGRICFVLTIIGLIYAEIYNTQLAASFDSTEWKWWIGTNNSLLALVMIGVVFLLFGLAARALRNLEITSGVKDPSAFGLFLLLLYGPLTSVFVYRRLLALQRV